MTTQISVLVTISFKCVKEIVREMEITQQKVKECVGVGEYIAKTSLAKQVRPVFQTKEGRA